MTPPKPDRGVFQERMRERQQTVRIAKKNDICTWEQTKIANIYFIHVAKKSTDASSYLTPTEKLLLEDNSFMTESQLLMCCDRRKHRNEDVAIKIFNKGKGVYYPKKVFVAMPTLKNNTIAEVDHYVEHVLLSLINQQTSDPSIYNYPFSIQYGGNMTSEPVYIADRLLNEDIVSLCIALYGKDNLSTVTDNDSVLTAFFGPEQVTLGKQLLKDAVKSDNEEFSTPSTP